MTRDDLRHALADLGKSQLGFGRELAVNPATVRKWLSGVSPVPGYVALIVRLMRDLRALQIRP